MKDVIEKSKQLILHTLLPKEKQVMKKIQSLDKEIIDYGKVLEILELKDFSKCNIDLGLHYFVNAKVKNTEYLYLDIGLGVLVEVNDQEARIIIPKQIAHLQRKKRVQEQALDELRIQMEQLRYYITMLEKQAEL